MTEHTKTPWRILPEEVNKDYIRIRGTVLGCRYKIANVLTPIYDGSPQGEADETRANAEFIVLACNAHYDLVEALEAANSYIDMLETPDDELDFDDKVQRASWGTWIKEKINESLAKAKAVQS